jgi:hypothetical protein
MDYTYRFHIIPRLNIIYFPKQHQPVHHCDVDVLCFLLRIGFLNIV